MRWLLIFIGLVTLLGATHVSAAEEAKGEALKKAQVAEEKALRLEQDAAATGSKPAPPPSTTITRTEAQAVDPEGKKPLDDPLTCLARTIYWEAKGEGRTGMEAIANVVMNRLGHDGFPKTICEVVTQGQEKGACQFSWWCDGRSDKPEENDSYAAAKEIARRALNGQLEDRTGGALYFHQIKVSPKWSAEYIKTGQVGQHLFYKPRGNAAK